MDYVINSKIHENHDSFIVGFNRWIKKEDLYILKKVKKQPFPIIISTQNLFCVIYIEKSWQSKSHRQRSKYSTFFYILLHYLLHQTPRPSALLPNNAFPFFADFSPPKTISIVRSKIEDTRSADTYVMQFSPWTRRSTLLSWKLAARGSILAAYFTEQWRRWALKPGGLETREGERAVLAC